MAEKKEKVIKAAKEKNEEIKKDVKAAGTKAKAAVKAASKKTADTAKKAEAAAKKATAKASAAAKKADDKAAAVKIEAKKNTRKAAAKVKDTAGKAGKAIRAKTGMPEIIIQSPMGGNITPADIVSKLPKGVESVFVRVDQNKLWWIKGEETGSVDIW